MEHHGSGDNRVPYGYLSKDTAPVLLMYRSLSVKHIIWTIPVGIAEDLGNNADPVDRLVKI